MKKNHEITIKVSEEELESIKKKAQMLGLPISSYMRMMSLGATITPTEHP